MPPERRVGADERMGPDGPLRELTGLNALVDAVRSHEPEAVAAALSELLLYTQTHFRREERLMELGAYPGLEGHRRAHRKFTGRVAEIAARFRANPSVFRAHEIYQMLADWLVDHVLGEDMRIKPYVAHLPEAQAA